MLIQDVGNAYRELRATTIGLCARQVLAGDQQGSVLGVTSLGAFLQAASGRVVFLSNESFRGPLMVNVSGGQTGLRSLRAGFPFVVEAGTLRFPGWDFSVAIHRANTWKTPAPLETALPVEAREARLETVARLVVERKGPAGASCLLLACLNQIRLHTVRDSPVAVDLSQLRQAQEAGDPASIGEALIAFLGAGSGLTPSGDDLILGFLLALNRWGESLRPGVDVGALNRLVISQVAGKTTALSANLIECAALSEADERLVLALDGILTGKPAPETCADHLSRWGNTSGGDALAGMALAIWSQGD